MNIYEALYTTRAMRRLKPDQIPNDVQARILDAAIRAPSGGNSQNWRFLLVDDPDLKSKIADLYRECMAQLWSTNYADRINAAKAAPNDPVSIGLTRMMRSAQFLADHFQETPLMFFGFAKSDPSGGSIFPSVWSAMLAARAEGVGSTLTTILAFRREQVFSLLGVPSDEGWGMAGCVTMGYPTGKWGVAPRRPATEVAARNSWTGPLGFEIPEPLWSETTE